MTFMNYREPLFRPPAEAESLIFQIAYGCPHNGCRFCGMYKNVSYRVRPAEEVMREIREAARMFPETARIFLADGDAMFLPFEILKQYLLTLNECFPRLARVNLYANGSSIAGKTDSELGELRRLKLHTLYVGLESGSSDILNWFGKRESPECMIGSVLRAQETGLKCSVMILVGLGGRSRSENHLHETVRAVNRMQPNLLSALRFIPVPGLALPDGFLPVTEYEAVRELRDMVYGFVLKRTVFRANHSSNPVPLAGRFPQDRLSLTAFLEHQLNSGTLDRTGPGSLPLFLWWTEL